MSNQNASKGTVRTRDSRGLSERFRYVVLPDHQTRVLYSTRETKMLRGSDGLARDGEH
jgi:hypothetical protein